MTTANTKENTGYVFENKGKWYARITYRDASGNRRNVKRTATDKKEAAAILRELRKKLATQGKDIFDKEKITFVHLADYYEQTYLIPAKIVNGQKVEGLRSLKTAKYYLSLFRDFFGSRRLSEITYDDLRRFRKTRLETISKRKKARSIASVNRELAYGRRCFNISVRLGWIAANPFNGGDSLFQVSAERKREFILSSEDEQRLLEACNHPRRAHLKPFLISLLTTGARKGETLRLRWRDIDFENKLITFLAQNTKTLRERQVAIAPRLETELRSLWEKSDKNLDNLVFGIKNNVRKSFSTACRIAGIKEGGIDGFVLHSCRHTVAVRLVRKQLPIQIVARILSHTQPQTTYRYISATNDVLHQAASILENS
jgi:integrase